jgi:hypothetical protein
VVLGLLGGTWFTPKATAQGKGLLVATAQGLASCVVWGQSIVQGIRFWVDSWLCSVPAV